MRASDERALEVRPGGLDLPAIEREVAARWAESGILGKSLARTASGPLWSCHVQPSAAIGVPGIGYARTRTAADLYARFKTMQGLAVPRGHVWDCHGLGVEVSVAHELGLSGPRLSEIGLPDAGLPELGLSAIGKPGIGKPGIGKSRSRQSGSRKSELGLSEIEEIERYGAERFVARCRDSALRHASAFAALAERMGCLTDPRKIFYTMDRSYIESVWWSLRQIFDAGLLVKDYRIGRYCPRCRTPLAEHEVRGPQVFKKVTGTSAIVRLPVERPPACAALRETLSGADLLAWTATPWMLAANTSAAVNPDEPYVVARRAGHGDKVVLADAGFARVLGEGWHIVAKLTGAELAGTAYGRPFVLAGTKDDGIGLVEADRGIRAYAGTGIAQLAAAYGGGELPDSPAHALDPIGADGCFGSAVASLAGLFFANADAAVVADLSDRGLLFSAWPNRRIQPHCWRCGTPVLTRAMTTWCIRTSAIRDRLPGQRLGLGAGAADWTVGRTRYWAVPLPIWECASDHLTCAGSLAELSELAGSDMLGLDPHRPAIDKVVIRCRTCGAPAYRVAETLDASYDTAAMPFAPHGTRPVESDGLAAGYPDPASLAVEGGGNARNWCDAMTVIAAICDGRAPFRRTISPGRALDERGRVIGGRQGNQADPTELLDLHGADALRWHFARATPERLTGKVTEAAIGQIRRRVLGAYLGGALFFAEHDDRVEPREPWLDGAALPAPERPVPERPVPERPVPGRPALERPVLDRWLLSELHSAVGEVTEGLEAFRSDVAARRMERLIADLAGWYLPLSRRRLAYGAAAGQAAAVLRTLRDYLDVLTRLMAPIAPHLTDHVWNLIRHQNAPESVHLATWPTALTTLVDERLSEQMARVRGIVGVDKAARAASMIGSWQPLATARLACEGSTAFTPELLTLIAEELNVENVEPVAVVPDAAKSPRWMVVSKPAGTVALEVVITPRLRLEGIATRSIRVIKQARWLNGLRIGDLVDLGWTTSDDEVGAALTEFSPKISQAVGAADCHRQSPGSRPGAGAIEHASPELAATFWLSPLPRSRA